MIPQRQVAASNDSGPGRRSPRRRPARNSMFDTPVGLRLLAAPLRASPAPGPSPARTRSRPTAFAAGIAGSPVPQAMSSTRLPGAMPASSIIRRVTGSVRSRIEASCFFQPSAARPHCSFCCCLIVLRIDLRHRVPPLLRQRMASAFQITNIRTRVDHRRPARVDEVRRLDHAVHRVPEADLRVRVGEARASRRRRCARTNAGLAPSPSRCRSRCSRGPAPAAGASPRPGRSPARPSRARSPRG